MSFNLGNSLKDIIKTLASNTLQFQQETRSSIHNLENQVSQLATMVNHLEAKMDQRLPSQPEVKPKNMSAMILRSGKEIEGPKLINPKIKSAVQIKKEIKEEGQKNTSPKVISNPVIQVKSN